MEIWTYVFEQTVSQQRADRVIADIVDCFLVNAISTLSKLKPIVLSRRSAKPADELARYYLFLGFIL